MIKMNRTHRTIVLTLLLASIALGFITWFLFLPVAFVGGYALVRTKCARFPALSSAAATAAGWIVVALFRDLFEGGRVSSKLASFLSLPHAVFVYPALFLLCAVPAFFAAYSGAALSAVYHNMHKHEEPAGS